MDNKIIDKIFKFVEKDIFPTIKKDLKWFGETINKDLKKLTKEKKTLNKNKKTSNED